MTKLITTQNQTSRVRPVRTRGGNMKYRALRLDSGNYSWGTESECLVWLYLAGWLGTAACFACAALPR